MRDASDMELLRDYARQNSEAAFAEVVRRHVNLVYSAALRHVGVAAQAEEITQAVFVILARKAASLREGMVLDAWLFQATRLMALSFLRGERRRQMREQEAYMQSVLQESTLDPVWQQLAPLLDEAIMRLGRPEREAVVLRFFKGRSISEVAEALSINEPAAQKRVSRALEKLRKYFTKRGVTSSTATIAETISAHSVQAAPAMLAKTATAVALAKGATASISTLTLIKGTLKIMAWTKAKTAVVVTIGVILAVGTTVVIHHQKVNFGADVPLLAPRSTQEIIGVGLALKFDAKTKAIQIASILPNSPAAQAGLSNDFVIQKIDGVSTADKKIAECVNLLRGAAGTKVRLELVDPNKNGTNTVELVRQRIQVSGTDSVTIQGTWSGRQIGDMTPGDALLIIGEVNLEFHDANTNIWYKATFSLRENTVPKQADILVSDCSDRVYVGKTAHAIYKVADGTLTFTTNMPGDPAMPTSLEDQNANRYLFTRKQ